MHTTPLMAWGGRQTTPFDGLREGGEGGAPGGGDGDGGGGGHVEVDGGGAAEAFHFAGVAVAEGLQECDARVADALEARDNFQRLVVARLGHEVTVHVDQHDWDLFPVDAIAGRSGEIVGFSEVEEFEIDRVVDVAEGVDVVKAQLHSSGTLPFIQVTIHSSKKVAGARTRGMANKLMDN